jgi:5-methylcytosine-specific restriction endonuclease McrA
MKAYKNKDHLRQEAISLRESGLGYRTISKQLSEKVPASTIANWVSHIKIDIRTTRKSAVKQKRKEISFETCKPATKKMFLVEERGYKCESCSNSEWLGKQIPLELEHIDGNNRNNDRSNLKLLCPNCHAFTPTYRGRNINKGKKKVSDSELKTALSRHKNIRQALIEVGLTPKGGNYKRATELKWAES